MNQRIFLEKKIPNGPRLILVPRKNVPSLTVLVAVPVGSRYESDNLRGVSHFIEHLLFKGTKKRPDTLALTRELDCLGAEYNAYTAKDRTAYHLKTIKKNQEKALDILSDMFFNPLCRKEDFLKEKDVIIEEIKMYKENPLFYIDDVFEQTLYGSHSLGKMISGEIGDIKKLSLKKLLEFKNNFYQPDKIVIVLAGNIQPNSEELIKKYFSPRKKITRKGKGFISFTKKRPCFKMKKVVKEVDQVQIALGGISYPYNDERNYPLSLLAVILGGYMSSRLFLKVRVEKGLAYFVRMDTNIYEDTGSFAVWAGVDKAKVKEAVKVILEEFFRVKKELITKEEIQRAKTFYEGRTKIQMENSDFLASFFAREAMFSKKILTPLEKIEKIKKVTPEQIQEVAKELFRPDNLALSLIGPFKGKVFKNIF